MFNRVGPREWFGGLVVEGNEVLDGQLKLVQAAEMVGMQEFPLSKTKPDLQLIEPGGVFREPVELDRQLSIQRHLQFLDPTRELLGGMGWAIVQNQCYGLHLTTLGFCNVAFFCVTLPRQMRLGAWLALAYANRQGDTEQQEEASRTASRLPACPGFPDRLWCVNQLSPPRLAEAPEPAQKHLLRRECRHKADCPGSVQQIPMSQRYQAWCAGRISGMNVDRDVVGGDLAPGVEAGSLVIFQQGIEGIDGIPLLPWSAHLQQVGDALHFPVHPFGLLLQVSTH